MTIHSRTVQTLADLDAVEWFRSVGVHDLNDAKVLGSWPDAAASCAAESWQELILEAANQYYARVVEAAPAVASEWNPRVMAVKGEAIALVRKKASSVIERLSLPKVVLDTIEWDILHLCIESEFADAYPPGFFASQGFYYRGGHFPCGWEGEFPAGRLVVY